MIVTTKRGGTDGKIRFNFSANTGIQQVAKRMDLLNRDQFWSISGSRTQCRPGVPIPMAALFDLDRNPARYRLAEEIFQTGVQQQYQLSANGGNEKSRFYISAGTSSRAEL